MSLFLKSILLTLYLEVTWANFSTAGCTRNGLRLRPAPSPGLRTTDRGGMPVREGDLTDSASDSDNKTENKFKKEGLLTQAYIKFLEIVIDKRDYRVRDVLKNAFSVIFKKDNEAEFDWMGRLKSVVPEVIGNYFTYTRISILKEEMKTRFYNKITNRTFAFDGDINEVINLANKFITQDQKKELDEVLEDFEKFPDSERTAKEICAELIDAFSRPFKENKQHQKFDNFLAEVLRILKREYPDSPTLQAIENPAEMDQYW